MNVQNKVFTILDSWNLSGKFCVAVSGGSDSLALCLIMAEYAKKKNIDLIAVTIDHSLRKESKEEAKLVHQELKKRNIAHKILTLEQTLKNNIQANARAHRYQLLQNFCAKQDIKNLFLGHIYEDQIENFFIRLERGSGVDGLAGIKQTSELNGLRLFRPLLEFKKVELQTYLKSEKQQWFEDPTNSNDKYLRNKVRKIINEIGIPDNRIMLAVQNLARASDYLNLQTEIIFKTLKHENDKFYLDTKEFKQIHEEIGLRLLNKIISKLSNNYNKLRLNSVLKLYEKIFKLDSFTSTLGGCKIRKYASKHRKYDLVLSVEN